MRSIVEVTITSDGMAKAVVTCGPLSRTVWLGAGRRYIFNPFSSDSRVEREGSRIRGHIGRTCVITDLLADKGSGKVRVRWEDTGRRGTVDVRDLELVQAREPAMAVRGRGGLVVGRSFDRSDAAYTERVIQKIESTGKYGGDDSWISKSEKRADRRQLCELCQRVRVAARKHRVCRHCFFKEGAPPDDLLEDVLNALAYERHVKGIPERWKVS